MAAVFAFLAERGILVLVWVIFVLVDFGAVNFLAALFFEPFFLVGATFFVGFFTDFVFLATFFLTPDFLVDVFLTDAIWAEALDVLDLGFDFGFAAVFVTLLWAFSDLSWA